MRSSELNEMVDMAAAGGLGDGSMGGMGGLGDVDEGSGVEEGDEEVATPYEVEGGARLVGRESPTRDKGL
jgi:hypothetical protein